jgi:hypothetical protein
VLAAGGLFLAQEWSRLSEPVQVVTLVVIALLLAAAGFTVARVGGGVAEMRQGRDDVRRRLTSALSTAAALAASLAAAEQTGIVIDDFSSWPAFVGGSVMLVLTAAGYAFAPSALGQLAMAAAGLTAIVNGLSVVGDGSSTLVPGLCVLAFATLWVAVAEVGWFQERVVARATGAAMALLGAQLPAFDSGHNTLAYVLTAAVAATGFVLYLRTAAWPYLVAGVAGITIVVPEAIIEWTDGSLGVAGAVLVAGLTLLGASLAGMRIRKEVVEG